MLTPKDQVITNPKIHLAVSLFTIPMFIIFFRSTFVSLLGFFLIDALSYAIFRHFDARIFLHFFPSCRLFFPSLKSEIYDIQDLKERTTLYEEINQFPKRRALFIAIISFFKVIPGFIYAFWAWNQGSSIGMIALKGFALCAFTFSYVIGMAFLEYHNLVTESLHSIHQKSNWSEIFKHANPPPIEKSFRHFEYLCAGGVFFFWLGMILLITFQDHPQNWLKACQILYVSAFGLYFISQIGSASRNQVTKGIESLIAYHSSSTLRVNPSGLALSTNPTLAWYQKTFNDMIERNSTFERDIHRLILHQAEDARFLQLGRVTGLLIHDLATPLTVMNHCISEMEGLSLKPNSRNQNLERLRFCINQVSDSIANLRSSLRENATSHRQSSLHKAHEAACKMISYMYNSEDYKRVSLQCLVNPQARVAFPQPELNQVLLNLYSNAITNLIHNKVAAPKLILEQIDEDKNHITLVIRDNGTGLSMQTFRSITEEAERMPGNEGIGLKLTKRLVELFEGTLHLKESSSFHGTEFILTLKRYSKAKSRPISPRGRPMASTAGLDPHPARH